MFRIYRKCQKIGVEMEMGRFRTQNALAQTIPDRVFGAGLTGQVQLDGKRDVWDLFLRVFNCSFQIPSFLKGDWALGYAST